MSALQKVISVKSLMERWNKSAIEVLFFICSREIDLADRDFLDIVPLGKEALFDHLYNNGYDEEDFQQTGLWLPNIEDLETKQPDILSPVDGIISGRDLMNRWNIAAVEVDDIIYNGSLEAVDPLGVSIHPEIIEELVDIYRRLNRVDLLFRITDVEKLEETNPELVKRREHATTAEVAVNKTVTDASGDKPDPNDPRELDVPKPLGEQKNVFYLKGTSWLVRYGDEEGFFPNHERHRYVSILLDLPNQAPFDDGYWIDNITLIKGPE